MKMCMNFKFVVLFALTLLAGSTVYGQDNVIDEVVWVVGDEAILKSEVEEARMSALYEGRKFDRGPLLCDTGRDSRTKAVLASGGT